jgi:hypothetical protein
LLGAEPQNHFVVGISFNVQHGGVERGCALQHVDLTDE